MAHHKRKSTKRRVKCTLCTTYRWQGNNKGRFKEKEEAAKQEWKRAIDKI